MSDSPVSLASLMTASKTVAIDFLALQRNASLSMLPWKRRTC